MAKNKRVSTKNKLQAVRPTGTRDASFFELVYQVVRQIPEGRVTTYGAIAACLGTRSSARMVGWAMNAAHDPSLNVPAHRVVNRNGMLTGRFHFSDPQEMQRLLQKENVEVVNDQITNFSKIFWDPTQLHL